MVLNRCLAFVFSLLCMFVVDAAAADGYVIAYGNGVGNSLVDARQSKEKLIELYGRTAPDGKSIDYYRAYAFSGDGFTTDPACDFTEVYLQNASSTDTWGRFTRALTGFAVTLSPGLSTALAAAVVTCTASVKAARSRSDYWDTDLQRQVNDYTRFIGVDGKKVLIVAHSQGNLYANLALRKVVQDTALPAGLNIAIVGVASPANEVAKGAGDGRTNPYVTSRSDLVIRGLNLVSPGTLNWNFAFSGLPDNPIEWGGFNETLTGDWKGHGFIPVYANSFLDAWPVVKQQIDAGFEVLVPVVPNQPPVPSFSVSVGSANTTTVEVGQTVVFDGRASSDPDGTIMNYEWKVRDALGTSTFSTSQQASRVFLLPGSYEVTLKVTDNLLASSEAKRAITVLAVTGNRSPIASFTATPAVVKVSGIVRLDASASRDPDGTIATYAWEFGDGQTSNPGPSIYETAYAAPGIYTARLTVTDNEGIASPTVTRDIRVTETDPGVILYDNVAFGGGCMQFLKQDDRFVIAARLGNGVGGYRTDFGHTLMRVSATGVIDPTFGSGGSVSISNLTPGFENIDGNSDLCLGAIDSLGRIILSSYSLRSIGDVSQRAHVIRLTENGALDTSFADHGIFRFDNARFDLLQTATNQITVDASNRIVVAGQSARLTCPFSACFWEGLAFRINANGALDDGFNAGAGVFTWTDPIVGFQPFIHSYFTGVAVDSLGRILLGGCTSYCANYQGEAYAVRLTPSGVLDTSFGDEGNRLLPLYNASDPANVTSMPGHRSVQNFSFDPDNRIVATGSNNYGGAASTIYRLLSDGTLDPTFTYGGVLRDFGWVRPFMTPAPVAQFERNGKTTLVGSTYVSYYDDYVAIGRLNAEGTPDVSFNQADIEYPSAPAQRAWHLLLGNALCNEAPGGAFMQPDGRILVAGRYACGSPQSRGGIYLMRINADGAIDPTFGQ